MHSFSPEFFGSFDIAETYARHEGHGTLTPWHLLYGMAKNPNLKCYESLSQKLPEIENRLAKLAKARQGEIRPNSELVQ